MTNFNGYLHNAIAMLDDDDQMLIRMLYFDEQTVRHCAEIFGVYPNAIQARKKRILAAIKKILELAVVQ